MAIHSRAEKTIDDIAQSLTSTLPLGLSTNGVRAELISVDPDGRIKTGWGPDMPSREVSIRFLGFLESYSPLIARIALRMKNDGPRGCWQLPLKSEQDEKGRSKYPLLTIGEHDIKSMVAHRALWKVFINPDITDATYLDHLCHDHSCCNLGHLDPVTSSTNAKRGNHARHIKGGQEPLFLD